MGTVHVPDNRKSMGPKNNWLGKGHRVRLKHSGARGGGSRLGRHEGTDFPGSSDDKDAACNVGDPGSIPGSGRFPGERNSKPLRYSCLENAMDRGTWWATVHGVAKSQT